MTVAELTARVDALLEAMTAARLIHDDRLLRKRLTAIADDLARLTLDLRTLPVTV